MQKKVKRVHTMVRAVHSKCAYVYLPNLSKRIPAQPTAKAGAVGGVFVDHQVGGVAGALGAETEAVQAGGKAREANRLAKGAVFLAGGGQAVRGRRQGYHVAIPIISAEVRPSTSTRAGVQRHPQQAADTTGSLHGLRKVQAPNVAAEQRAVAGPQLGNVAVEQRWVAQ